MARPMLFRRLLFCTIAAALTLVAGTASAAPPELEWSALFAITTKQQGDNPVIGFDPKISALNGQIVTIRGWITTINLGDGTSVRDFLLTGTPGTCPFCLGRGPEGFVLIDAAQPVPADATVELLLQGQFGVNANDPSGFYYQLRNAKVIGHP
jgi:hypothetical protein